MNLTSATYYSSINQLIISTLYSYFAKQLAASPDDIDLVGNELSFD